MIGGCSTTASVFRSEYRARPNEKLTLKLSTPMEFDETGALIFKYRLTTQLASSHLLSTSPSQGTKTLEINVNYYYMRSDGKRFFAGVFAGADNIQSTVKVKDPTTGKVLSEFNVESKNPTAWGTTRGMIEDHADKIVEVLRISSK
jgi:hypothetical protein